MLYQIPQGKKTADLDVGYTQATNTWELIIKYHGSLNRVKEELGISAVELANQYVIITIPETKIDRLAQYEEIKFIEKPKYMREKELPVLILCRLQITIYLAKVH